jgi:hypothetical protein
MTLHGEPVFRGVFEGVGEIATARRFDPDRMALVADVMTTEIANFCIGAGVRAVVTGSGGFACHGANLLRAAARRTDFQLPVWITDLACEAGDLVGRPLRLELDGTLEVPGPPPRMWQEARHQPIEHVAWGEGIGVSSRLFWPHRTYDVLTASLMTPGLARDMTAVTGTNVTALRSDQGHIWFQGASLGLAELTDMAVSVERSDTHLAAQIANHASIFRSMEGVEQLDPSERLVVLMRLVEKYFETFVLFHNTYTRVFASLPDKLRESGAVCGGDQLLQSVMRCELVDWLQAQRISLRNRKSLFDADHAFVIPTVGFEEDLDLAVNRVEDQFASVGLAGRQALRHAAGVFVAKEWKFFVNKMLFSAFARAIQVLESNGSIPPIDRVASLSASELLDFLGASGD